MKHVYLLFLLITLSSLCEAQQSYMKEIEADISSAQETLIEQRKKLAEEQKTLSKQLTKLQNEVLEKRRLADIARRSVSDNAFFLKSLRDKEFASSRAADTLNDELRVYGMQLETKRLPGEAKDDRLQGAFQKEGSSTELMKSRLVALELGMSQLEDALGGSRISAIVTDSSARMIGGDVISFGPARWFVSEDGTTSGSYHLSPSWQVAGLHENGADAAKLLASGQVAVAMIDITGGKAQALKDLKSSPIDLVKKGGAWVYPILVIGLASLVCALLKILQLSKIKEPKDSWIESVIGTYKGEEIDKAQQQAKSARHPVADVLPDCIEASSYGLEVVEEILYERMITVKESLRRWLPFIATTAAIAPLLGLLGTVSGLIRTFSVIAVEGTGEAQSISGGISEALITTLFGLAIAIPAFMAHSLLSRKAKGVEQNTERLTLKFVNALRRMPEPHGK